MLKTHTMILVLTVMLASACGGGGGGGAGGDEDGAVAPGGNAGGNAPGNGIFTPSGSKPDSLPDYQDVGLYAADAPVNQRLTGDEPIDPDSARYVAHIADVARDAGGIVLAWRRYSSPVYFADADTARYAVELPCGSAWELGVTRLSGVPIPGHAEPADDIDGETLSDTTCGENSDQDNHMVIIDRANRCEYDLWQARLIDGQWYASWGNAISLDSNGVYPGGLSSRGSGFAFMGGVIWPDELASGQIRHALVFSYPSTRAGGPVPPATESDGWSDADNALPEGTRIRLDPDLDLDSLGLDAVERTVARALQEYGAWLVDDGGGVQIYAVDPRSTTTNPYGEMLPDEDYPVLRNIPLDRLQVLELPEQDAAWQDGMGLVDTGCNRFE